MRRFVFFFLSTIMLMTSVPAQTQQPVVKKAAIDTSIQKANPPADQPEQFGMMEREHHRLTGSPREKIDACQPDDQGCCRYEPMSMGMMFHPMRHHVFFPALCVMCCLFVCLLINILLTVLVALDMARRRQFNGLWIPVLLLMGIPGTGLYALFRIGDNIAANEHKS